MLSESRDLIEAGGAVVVLRARDKRPADAKWTELPRWTWDEASKQFPAGANIGLRLGAPSEVNGRYIHGLDLDIRSDDPRDIDAAHERLAALLGEDVGRLACVQSGSGGASRHYYFLSDKAFRPRKLAHAPNKVEGEDGKKHWAWEIDLGGTGRQFVLPPSIHPITRKPYRWEHKVDWDCLPNLPAARVASWLPVDSLSTGKKLDDELRDLVSWWREQPKHFAESEITDILDGLSTGTHARNAFVEDREGWLRVGMALHHQYGGAERGFERWCAFSGDSDKFDEEDQWRVWRSFAKTSGSNNPVTMASLLRASRAERLGEETGSSAPRGWMHEGSDDELPDDFGARTRRAYDRDRVDSLLDGDAVLSDEHHDALSKALRQGRRDEENEADEWRRELDYNDAGGLRPNVHNMALVTAFDWRLRGWLGYNEFTGEQVQRRPLKLDSMTMIDLPQRDWLNGDNLKREHEVNLRLFLAKPRVGKKPGYGMAATDRDLKTAIVSACYQGRFHPIKSYLNRLSWDGVERIHTLFPRYLGTPDEPYYREVARLMMVAGVARVFEPGHKFDYAVILEGEEGLRKSSFIRALAARDEWFGEMHGDFHDRKGLVEQMQGKWIIEMPELSGFNKSDVQAVKAFMSTTADNVRLAYEARSTEFKRQCVLLGSTNDQRYLLSETGNRRFFPVRVERLVDTSGLRGEIDLLWAEAVARYFSLRAIHPASQGALPLYLRGEAAQAYALQAQADRKVDTVSDVLFGPIEVHLNELDTIDNITGSPADKFDDHLPRYRRVKACAKQIHRDLPDLFGGRPLSEHDIRNINLALKRLGWERATVRFGALGQQRGWKRPDATEAEVRHGYLGPFEKE